jgi:hypothetical protein
MTRGLSIKVGSSTEVAIPISEITHTPTRNLITEKSFGKVTETAIYGGGVIFTGSFGGAYRPYQYQDVLKSFVGGSLSSIDAFTAAQTATLHMGDAYGNNFEYSSCAITSFEINLAAGDYCKVTSNWVGTFATDSGVTVLDTADYSKGIPIFYNADIAGMKVKSFRLNMARPFDQNNYIIGSEYLQDLVQSDSVTVSGSFTVSAKDYTLFKKVIATGDPNVTTPSTTNKNNVTVDGTVISLRTPDGTDTLQTITISTLVLSDGSASANGANEFEKTINFRVPVDNSTHKLMFGTPVDK